MGYIKDLETEVRTALKGGADHDMIVKLFKEKVWESYKNGQRAGKYAKTQNEPEGSN